MNFDLFYIVTESEVMQKTPIRQCDTRIPIHCISKLLSLLWRKIRYQMQSAWIWKNYNKVTFSLLAIKKPPVNLRRKATQKSLTYFKHTMHFINLSFEYVPFEYKDTIWPCRGNQYLAWIKLFDNF